MPLYYILYSRTTHFPTAYCQFLRIFLKKARTYKNAHFVITHRRGYQKFRRIGWMRLRLILKKELCPAFEYSGGMNHDEAVNQANKLVPKYLPLLFKVSRRIARRKRQYQAEELLTFAYQGLVDAVRTYEASKGASFFQHAKKKIEWAVLNGIREDIWSGEDSRHMRRKISQAIDMAKEMSQKEGRMVKVTETLQMLSGQRPAKTYSLEHDDTEEYRRPYVDKHNYIGEIEGRMYFDELIGVLDKRSQAIFRGIYVQGKTGQDVADDIGLSESRVNLLHKEGILKICEYLGVEWVPHRMERQWHKHKK